MKNCGCAHYDSRPVKEISSSPGDQKKIISGTSDFVPSALRNNVKTKSKSKSNAPPVIYGPQRNEHLCYCKGVQDPFQSVTSVSSEDLSYFDDLKCMNEEEERLKNEIAELERKNEAYLKTINLCTAETPTKDVENTQELEKLKRTNEDLNERNRELLGQYEDLKLELRQLQERIEGPMQRELDRERRKSDYLEYMIKRRTRPEKSNVAQKQINFLKGQIEYTNNIVRELTCVNNNLKEEAAVLSYKCNKLQEVIVKQKQAEMKTISKYVNK